MRESHFDHMATYDAVENVMSNEFNDISLLGGVTVQTSRQAPISFYVVLDASDVRKIDSTYLGNENFGRIFSAYKPYFRRMLIERSESLDRLEGKINIDSSYNNITKCLPLVPIRVKDYVIPSYNPRVLNKI